MNQMGESRADRAAAGDQVGLIQPLAPAGSARPAQSILDLSMNEGLPPPEESVRQLAGLDPAVFARYQDPGPLEEAYADYLGVSPEQVFTTTGADDAIDRVCRAYLRKGREMVFPTPTFYMVPAYARMAQGRLVPLEYDWGTLPHERILEAVSEKTGLVAVLSPDNPTGHAFPADELLTLARSLPDGVTFMHDAAYAEFGDEEPAPVLLGEPNVVMIRTLSKCWGLAGLRIGFAVSSAERIEEIRRFAGPYPVSGPGVAVALECLANGRKRMQSYVESVRTGRERLAELMRRASGEPEPSRTNFVLGRFAEPEWIHKGLVAQGVLTRTFPSLPDYVRITVPRDEAEFARLEESFATLARPQVVLFDMDGVLADVSESYRVAISETCALFGVLVSQEEIDAAKAAGDANDDWDLTYALVRRGGGSASADEVRVRFEELYQGTDGTPGLRRHESLIPRRDLLEDLAGSLRLGVVTGRPRRDAERFLEEHKIAHLFDAVVCREDAPSKPDPGPVLLAMELLGGGGAWMLGDTPDDVVAAHAAGVVPVGVLPPRAGTTLREALAEAGAARVVGASADFEGIFG